MHIGAGTGTIGVAVAMDSEGHQTKAFAIAGEVGTMADGVKCIEDSIVSKG